MSITDIASRVRRDEYTGENRCLPCTVVNAGIAVGVAGFAAWTVSPSLATVVLVACLATIYLRGYLVPGTPTLTRRYLPAGVLRLFGKTPVPERATGTDLDERGTDTGGQVATDVLVQDGSSLDPDFREAWWDAIDAVRESGPEPAEVAALFDAEECTARSDVSFVVDGSRLVRWESPAALVADLAAHDVLGSRLDGWSRLDDDERRDLLTALRLFLDRCPACEGPVSVAERRVDPCCQPAATTARSTCEECDATVADVSVPGTDGGTPVGLRLVRSSLPSRDGVEGA